MTAGNISSIIIGWFVASCKKLICLMQWQITSLFREKTTKDEKQI
jgi:hypothetical protein